MKYGFLFHLRCGITFAAAAAAAAAAVIKYIKRASYSSICKYAQLGYTCNGILIISASNWHRIYQQK